MILILFLILVSFSQACQICSQNLNEAQCKAIQSSYECVWDNNKCRQKQCSDFGLDNCPFTQFGTYKCQIKNGNCTNGGSCEALQKVNDVQACEKADCHYNSTTQSCYTQVYSLNSNISQILSPLVQINYVSSTSSNKSKPQNLPQYATCTQQDPEYCSYNNTYRIICYADQGQCKELYRNSNCFSLKQAACLQLPSCTFSNGACKYKNCQSLTTYDSFSQKFQCQNYIDENNQKQYCEFSITQETCIKKEIQQMNENECSSALNYDDLTWNGRYCQRCSDHRLQYNPPNKKMFYVDKSNLGDIFEPTSFEIIKSTLSIIRKSVICISILVTSVSFIF